MIDYLSALATAIFLVIKVTIKLLKMFGHYRSQEFYKVGDDQLIKPDVRDCLEIMEQLHIYEKLNYKKLSSWGIVGVNCEYR